MKSFRSAIVRFGMAMLTVSCLLASWAITVPLAPAQENKASAPAQTPPPGKKSQVDVNSADLKTLQTLPGIGPVLAQRIIDGRPYKTLADVAKVKGLSPAKLDAIKDTLTFGSAATLATQTAKPAKPAKSVTAAAVSEPQAPATPAAAQPARGEQEPVRALDFGGAGLWQPDRWAEAQHQQGHRRRVGPPPRNWSRQGQGHH